MERKYEKLSLAELGILILMVLILLISLGAGWYLDSQKLVETSKVNQELVPDDSNYNAVENAVIELEGNKTKEKLDLAQAAVASLTDSGLKAKLQARIDKVQLEIATLIDAQTKASLEKEKKKASTSADSSSVNDSLATETGTEYSHESATSNDVASVQNTYSSLDATTTYTPPASQADTSTTPVSEVSEAPVAETPVTEASTATETSVESPVASETPATSSTDNP
ncbi:serine protease [Streptococcus suis]|uniref:serine protease n=1 Tax=Streptococcus suis TaxID=1307 RepID=UPI000CF42F9C|nr:serine protease [Streptococcus suis]